MLPVASRVTEEIGSFTVKVEGKSVSSVIHVTVPPPLPSTCGKVILTEAVSPKLSSAVIIA